MKNADASQGLGQDYRFISYLVHVEDEKVMQDVFWRRAPGHRPAWCTVMAKEINVKGMRAEIAAEGVVYHDV